MKKFVYLLLVLAVFAACDAAPAESQEQQQQEIPETEDQVLADQEVISNDELSVEVEDDTLQIDVSESTDGYTGTDADISEWCVPGEVYDFAGNEEFSESEVDVQADIIGITTYNSETVCELAHEMETQGMTIETAYFINEDITTLYLETNVAGQTQKSEVSLA